MGSRCKCKSKGAADDDEPSGDDGGGACMDWDGVVLVPMNFFLLSQENSEVGLKREDKLALVVSGDVDDDDSEDEDDAMVSMDGLLLR